MKEPEQTVMPFCKNWAKMAIRKNDSARLHIFDVFLNAAFFGKLPDESDDAGMDFYFMIEPMLARREEQAETRRKRAEAGRKGGSKGGRPRKQNATENLNETLAKPYGNPNETLAKPYGNPNETLAKLPIIIEKNKEDKNTIEQEESRSEVCATQLHTPSPVSDAGQPSAVEADAPRPLPCRPSAEDLKVAAHNVGAPDWFLDEFVRRMDECGWCELNSRSPTGDVIPVTRKNVVRILAGWWNQEKKNSAAREAERRAEAAYAPETGLGFRSVPDATMEIV